MDRREFLRRSAIVATGVVAADQLDLLERLFYKRRFFPGFTNEYQPGDGWLIITREMIEDDMYAFPAERLSRGLREQWSVEYKDVSNNRIRVVTHLGRTSWEDTYKL